MKAAVVILFILAFTAEVSGGSSLPLPAGIGEASAGEVKAYLTKVSDIPGSVMDAVKRAMPREKMENMADRGGRWNKTDVVMVPDLPFYRLIWAVEVKKHFVIHYEKGGIAYGTHFLIVSPEDRNGKRTLEWSGFAFSSIAQDFPTFLKMVADGKIISQ